MDWAMILSVGVPIALLIVEYYIGESSGEANSSLALVRDILKKLSGRG